MQKGGGRLGILAKIDSVLPDQGLLTVFWTGRGFELDK